MIKKLKKNLLKKKKKKLDQGNKHSFKNKSNWY